MDTQVETINALKEELKRWKERFQKKCEEIAELKMSGYVNHSISDDTAYIAPFGTVRQCRYCDCLVAGGPTVCRRCAEEQEHG